MKMGMREMLMIMNKVNDKNNNSNENDKDNNNNNGDRMNTMLIVARVIYKKRENKRKVKWVEKA